MSERPRVMRVITRMNVGGNVAFGHEELKFRFLFHH